MKYLDLKGCALKGKRGDVKGVISDLIIDKNKQKVYSIIIEQKKTVFSHFFILKLSDIKLENNLIVSNYKPYSINSSIINSYKNNFFNNLLDKPIIDKDENELGLLKDIIIDEKDGAIKAFICSRGVIEDMVDGRRVILLDASTKFYSDKILTKSQNFSIYNDMSLWKHTKE